MKPLLTIVRLASILLLTTAGASATVYLIDFSPTGIALSTTNYGANRDHATGLSGLNENPANVSPATGNEIGTGITYDDASNILSFQFAYGAGFGFTNLTGSFTDAHIHGPSGPSNYPAVNTNAGVLHSLVPSHTAFSTTSGSFSGSQLLSAANETNLLNNLLYVNIHSSAFTGGEIRGQLIAVPEPSRALLLLGGLGALGLRRRR